MNEIQHIIPFVAREHSDFFFFFFNDTATTEIYTLSLHDALPICSGRGSPPPAPPPRARRAPGSRACTAPCRSEEHTSELQSRSDLVCRLLLEKKKNDASTSPDLSCATGTEQRACYARAHTLYLPL